MKEADDLGLLNINSSLYKTRLSKKFINRKIYKSADPKIVVSFIPGSVLEILVKEGQQVEKGEALLILDAMKMQNQLKSQIKGTIKKINVIKGEKVPKGIRLIEFQ